MLDTDANRKSLIRYQRVTLKTKVADRELVCLLCFISTICFAAALIISFDMFIRIDDPTSLIRAWLSSLVLTVVFNIGALLVVCMLDQLIFGKSKSELEGMEKRVFGNCQPLSLEETNGIVKAAIRAKHHLVANFYSTEMTKLRTDCSDERLVHRDWMISTDCWASSPSYGTKVDNKMSTAFETHGILTLSRHLVSLGTRRFEFQCLPSQIESIEIKQFPRWISPIATKYLEVSIDFDGNLQNFIIAPRTLLFDTIWNRNRKIANWANYLAQAQRTSKCKLNA